MVLSSLPDASTREPAVISPQALADEAIARVGAHADQSWLDAAIGVVGALALLCDTFTTDDVWQMLDKREVTPTHEPRAMGAVMRRAKRAGVCAASDSYTPSTRPESHGRPIRVWVATP